MQIYVDCVGYKNKKFPIIWEFFYLNVYYVLEFGANFTHFTFVTSSKEATFVA